MKATIDKRLTRRDLSCIEVALKYIEQNHRNSLCAESLAEEVNLAIKKLQAGIKVLTGHTLHNYHFKIRLEKAKQLLADTPYSIKCVAAKVGFKNESHFCQRFRLYAGVTPGAYRSLIVQDDLKVGPQ
jgi:transcriptional regulator GlxA family with amidase domain